MKLRLYVIAALAVCAAAIAFPVTAQPIDAAVAEGGLWDTINDSLYTLALAVIPVLGTIIGYYVKRWAGERAAQIAQTMFQSAAERAAAKALAEKGVTPDTPQKAKDAASDAGAVKSGVDYLKATMPDTVKANKLDDKMLQDIVVANMGKLILGAVKK